MTLKHKDYGDTNFITGMRAVAAFAVLLIHSGGAGLYAFGPTASEFVGFGRTGVYAFFVISGYSISASYQSSGDYFQYLNRRMWRIAPIYYFWLAVAIFSEFSPISGNFGGGTSMPSSIDARNIWMHLSFMSFMDYKITNSILGVEWSISIEVFWYILAPLMLFFIRGRVMVALAVATSFYWFWKFAQYPTYLPWLPVTWVQDSYDVGLAMHWSPLPYVASYCLGIGAFRLRESMPDVRRYGNAAFAVVILICAAFLTFHHVAIKLVYHEVLFSSLMTAILIVFGSKNAALYRWAFSNRIMVFLGTISYGIYLPQFLLLAVLKPFFPAGSFVIFLALCVSSVIVSYVLCRLVERPLLNFGTSLEKRLRLRRL